MPELPDVEMYRREFAKRGLGRPVVDVEVRDAGILDGVSARTLAKKVEGHAFKEAHRHGKWLFGVLDHGAAVVMHFGMTGDLQAFEDGEPPRRGLVLFRFDEEAGIAFIETRKLGRVAFTPDVDAFLDEKKLGPDASGLELHAFRERLECRNGGLKATLMNQSVVAGLGNVYVDEILHAARFSPKRSVKDLDEADVRKLHGSMRRVLARAIRVDADPDRFPDSWITPVRRGGKCPGCKGDVKRETVAGRTTAWCPACQR